MAQAAPDWKSEITPPVYGPFAKLEPMSLDYQVSWKGVLNSGHLHIEFAPPWDKKPGTYVCKAHAVSQGAAAAVHPYTFNAWSELAPATLMPRYVRAKESHKNGTDIAEVRYFTDRVETESTETSIYTKGKTEVKNRVFNQPAVFDIFSAMLFIRSQKLDDGDKIQIVVQASDQPYVLQVRCLGREVHEGRKTIKLSAGMRRINRDTLELKPYKKLKKDATLWLSDDADRVPVELRADIFVGDVRAVMTSRKKL